MANLLRWAGLVIALILAIGLTLGLVFSLNNVKSNKKPQALPTPFQPTLTTPNSSSTTASVLEAPPGTSSCFCSCSNGYCIGVNPEYGACDNIKNNKMCKWCAGQCQVLYDDPNLATCGLYLQSDEGNKGTKCSNCEKTETENNGNCPSYDTQVNSSPLPYACFETSPYDC